MASIRKQILDAIIAALNASPPPGTPNAELTKLRAATGVTTPSIGVYSDDQDTEASGIGGGPLLKHDLVVGIDVIAAGADIEAALDPHMVHVSNSLNGKRMMDGSNILSTEILEVGTGWVYAHAEKLYGMASIQFKVTYQTKTTNAEATK